MHLIQVQVMPAAAVVVVVVVVTTAATAAAAAAAATTTTAAAVIEAMDNMRMIKPILRLPSYNVQAVAHSKPMTFSAHHSFRASASFPE